MFDKSSFYVSLWLQSENNSNFKFCFIFSEDLVVSNVDTIWYETIVN